jgi:bacillolysin
MDRLNEIIEAMRRKDPKITVAFNAEQSAITTLFGKLSGPVKVAELRKTPYPLARHFIQENRALLGGINEAAELVDGRTTTDRRGMTHVMFQQMHGKARVLGGVVSVHYAEDGSVYMLKSSLAAAIDLPKEPKVTSNSAVAIAQKHAGRGAMLYKGMKPVLLVADAKTVNRQEEKPRYYLCWQMRIIPPKGSRDPDWIYLVNAIAGDVLLRYTAIQTGTGVGYYSMGAALNSEASGGTNVLRDSVTSTAWPVATKPKVQTYDDAGSGSLGLTGYSEDADDTWDNGGVVPASRSDDQRAEVDIHRFMGYVLSYYYLTHGLNSWDGAGVDFKGHAHNMYFAPFVMPNNSFWDPGTEQVYFGDGDGTDFDFMCPLNIVGHELTHGVNYGFNVVQTYSGETGAINEALADLFGALIALGYPADCPQPWDNGEQATITGRGRDLADPSRDDFDVVQYDDTSDMTKLNSAMNGYFPDHYSIKYNGSSDNHGVHINSTIISHAVYLMAYGGTHRLSLVPVTAIGVAVVEEMLFYVISTPGLLTNSSDFADFRLAFIAACQTLYPENLDYLATVKTAFHAVGIGPDLYVRDTLADQGAEPGTVSCMSPDIILRQSSADAATLTAIADVNNASLGQNIELGPADHYVYFRVFNRGSAAASGTFRLFISPVSTFPTPATWSEVGHYDFPSVTASGGVWVPTAAGECITLTSALINTLGTGHYCFIGIIESTDDPAPDRMLISDIGEFYAFIGKSNNYAWRNCNIENIYPDTFGNLPVTEAAFQLNDFGRRFEPRDIEVNTRDLPEGTRVEVFIPQEKLAGVKAFEVQAWPEVVGAPKIAGALLQPLEVPVEIRPVPISRLAEVEVAAVARVAPSVRRVREPVGDYPLAVAPNKVMRLAGLTPRKGETTEVRFKVQFPRNTGPRDVTLTFSERVGDGIIGQMNYVYRIRKAMPVIKPIDTKVVTTVKRIGGGLK